MGSGVATITFNNAASTPSSTPASNPSSTAPKVEVDMNAEYARIARENDRIQKENERRMEENEKIRKENQRRSMINKDRLRDWNEKHGSSPQGNTSGGATSSGVAPAGSLGTCVVCEKDLSGSIVEFAGKSYHQDCFKCHTCKRAFSTNPQGQIQAICVDGWPYCERDGKIAFVKSRAKPSPMSPPLKMEEEKNKKEDEERKRKAEGERMEEEKKRLEDKRRMEEERKREDERKRKADEEESRRKQEDERKRKAEEERKRQEDERKRQEEERKRADEKKRLEEEATRKKQEEERKRQEDERKRQEDERKRQEEERKRQEERKRVEEEQRRKQEEERKKQEEEARKREEARREEEDRIRREQDAAKREALRKESEERRKKEEEDRKRAEEERKKKETEDRTRREEQERKMAEDERKKREDEDKKRVEDEKKRKAAEDERKRKEDEDKRKKDEEERKRKVEEERRRKEEEDKKKIPVKPPTASGVRPGTASGQSTNTAHTTNSQNEQTEKMRRLTSMFDNPQSAPPMPFPEFSKANNRKTPLPATLQPVNPASANTSSTPTTPAGSTSTTPSSRPTTAPLKPTTPAPTAPSSGNRFTNSTTTTPTSGSKTFGTPASTSGSKTFGTPSSTTSSTTTTPTSGSKKFNFTSPSAINTTNNGSKPSTPSTFNTTPSTSGSKTFHTPTTSSTTTTPTHTPTSGSKTFVTPTKPLNPAPVHPEVKTTPAPIPVVEHLEVKTTPTPSGQTTTFEDDSEKNAKELKPVYEQLETTVVIPPTKPSNVTKTKPLPAKPIEEETVTLVTPPVSQPTTPQNTNNNGNNNGNNTNNGNLSPKLSSPSPNRRRDLHAMIDRTTKGASMTNIHNHLQVNTGQHEVGVAEYDFTAEEENELTFVVGDKIELLCIHESGEWAEGRNQRTGQVGWFLPELTTLHSDETNRFLRESMRVAVVSPGPELLPMLEETSVLDFNFIPNYCGYLNKQSPGILKKWQRRWFSLQEDQIVYYNEEQERFSTGKECPPIGMIYLRIVKNVEAYSDSRFVVYTPERTYWLQADTDEIRDRWIFFINMVLKRLKSQQDHKPQKKEGWLLKRSRVHKWNRRWLVVQGGVLCWYKGPFQSQHGKVPLYHAVLEEYKPDEKSCAFVVTSPTDGSSAIFQAESDEEMHLWLNAIVYQKIVIEEKIDCITFV